MNLFPKTIQNLSTMLITFLAFINVGQTTVSDMSFTHLKRIKKPIPFQRLSVLGRGTTTFLHCCLTCSWWGAKRPWWKCTWKIFVQYIAIYEHIFKHWKVGKTASQNVRLLLGKGINRLSLFALLWKPSSNSLECYTHLQRVSRTILINMWPLWIDDMVKNSCPLSSQLSQALHSPVAGSQRVPGSTTGHCAARSSQQPASGCQQNPSANGQQPAYCPVSEGRMLVFTLGAEGNLQHSFGHLLPHAVPLHCSVGGEALAQVAWRGGECPVPTDIHGQAEQGSEEPDEAVGVPVSCREVELDGLWKSFTTQKILCWGVSYKSRIKTGGKHNISFLKKKKENPVQSSTKSPLWTIPHK